MLKTARVIPQVLHLPAHHTAILPEVLPPAAAAIQAEAVIHQEDPLQAEVHHLPDLHEAADHHPAEEGSRNLQKYSDCPGGSFF